MSGTDDKAIVAHANNRFNFIPKPYDMLISPAGRDYWISGEKYMHVKHQLLGTKDATLRSVKEVHSHTPALGQCMEFFSPPAAQCTSC